MPTTRFSINVPLHFLAGQDVQAPDYEKQHHDSDKNKIRHNFNISRVLAVDIIKTGRRSIK